MWVLMTSFTVAFIAVASLSDVVVGYDHNRATGVAGEVAADRPQQQLPVPARAARTDDDHLGARGGAEKLLGWVPADSLDGDPGPGEVRARLGEGLVGLFFG